MKIFLRLTDVENRGIIILLSNIMNALSLKSKPETSILISERKTSTLHLFTRLVNGNSNSNPVLQLNASF